MPIISKCPSSSVPTKEMKKPQIVESVVAQGFQGTEKAENANVRSAGWLCSFDMDYRHRGISKHYRVDVMAALPEGGGAE